MSPGLEFDARRIADYGGREKSRYRIGSMMCGYGPLKDWVFASSRNGKCRIQLEGHTTEIEAKSRYPRKADSSPSSIN